MTTIPSEKTNGPGLAAIVAASFGVFVLGLDTFLGEWSAALLKWFNWWSPAGPLVGKTGVAVIAWLVVWAALHPAWGRREVSFPMWWKVSLGLIVIGSLLMFPPIFHLARP
jgi:hypothetical protein